MVDCIGIVNHCQGSLIRLNQLEDPFLVAECQLVLKSPKIDQTVITVQGQETISFVILQQCKSKIIFFTLWHQYSVIGVFLLYELKSDDNFSVIGEPGPNSIDIPKWNNHNAALAAPNR